METQPLILLASARKDSNTRRLVQKVFQETPHQLLDLLEYQVPPYQYEQEYPPGDQFLLLVEKMLAHQVLVFATPVYWYAMSGSLKNFFDRFTDLVTTHKTLGRQLEGKTMFLVAVGADDALPDGFEVPFKLTAKYLNMKFGSTLYGSTEEVETDLFHLGNLREFLREMQEAQKNA
ncbi:flavodoxin family protein [Rufibacter sp. LB8]|uniref:flavodoxin family protein n=1 Tax=Rufibacter sp. LB8 TaxID=2777781 RepID=UPI00178C4A13|nr:NAD(P)H-dependent oxidoreductase [Rufibacter sp. LB8]